MNGIKNKHRKATQQQYHCSIHSNCYIFPTNKTAIATTKCHSSVSVFSQNIYIVRAPELIILPNYIFTYIYKHYLLAYYQIIDFLIVFYSYLLFYIKLTSGQAFLWNIDFEKGLSQDTEYLPLVYLSHPIWGDWNL